MTDMHTPTPWERDPATDWIGHPGSEGSEGEWDETIAHVFEPANADLIVEAVNEHAALLRVEASLRAHVDFLPAGAFGDHAREALRNVDVTRKQAKR